MKIVADKMEMSIEFAKTILTYGDPLDGLFSIQFNFRAEDLAVHGENIWLDLYGFDWSIAILKKIHQTSKGRAMIQSAVEASEYYGEEGDQLFISFESPSDECLPCRLELHTISSNEYGNPNVRSYRQLFEIHLSAIPNLITDFEALKAVVIADLERRLREGKSWD